MIERLKESTPGRVVARFVAVNAGLYAAVIAYSAVFSIFPILLALLTLVGLVLRDPLLSNRFQQTLPQLFPADIASQIVYVIAEVREAGGLLGIVSFLWLLWAGHTLFAALAEGFNRIYGVKNRPMMRQVATDVGMIFLFAILLALSLLGTAAAQIVSQFLDRLSLYVLPGYALLVTVVSYAISLVAAFVMFVAIYYFVPNVRLTFSDVWPGALLTAVLFVILLQVFPIYVGLIGQFGRFGAVFGFLFLTLTWLNLVAQIVLVGATMNAVRKPGPIPRD